ARSSPPSTSSLARSSSRSISPRARSAMARWRRPASSGTSPSSAGRPRVVGDVTAGASGPMKARGRPDHMLLPALLLAVQASNVPELPKDVPAAATKYSVTMMGLAAGQHAVWTEGGRLRAFFQYNDRGRGPRTYSTISLRDGVPVGEQIDGNDYMKDAVNETFSFEAGTASWKSKAEQGS